MAIKKYHQQLIENPNKNSQPTAGLADDFKALQTSLDDSSDKNRNFLIAFLLLTVYIVITLSSTTDVNLLLINQQPAPSLLSFKLSLLNFYMLAPMVLIVFHFNLLFNLKTHRAKLQAWLNHPANDHNSHYHRLRAYLYNIWATHSYQRSQSKQCPTTRDYQLFNTLINTLFVLLPLVLLLTIFWRMCDLQNLRLSIWHLGCVLLNLGLIRYYWPTIASDQWQTSTKNRPQKSITIINWLTLLILAGRLTTLLLALHTPYKLQPWLEQPLLNPLVPHINASKLPLNQTTKDDTQLTSTGFIKANADWSELTAVTQCKLNQNYQKTDLAGRNLNLLNLSNAKLCNVDFTNSKLQGANLSKSTFAGDFTLADLSYADLSHTKLQRGSQLLRTNLDHSNMAYTIANGVDFTLASLQQTKILGAELAYSHFIQAKLDNSSFTRAELQFANFMGASFTISKFIETPLIGVDLRFAKQLDTQVIFKNSPIENCITDNNTVADNVKIYQQSNCKRFDTQITAKAAMQGLKHIYKLIKEVKKIAFEQQVWQALHKITTQQDDTAELQDLALRLIAVTAISQNDSIDLSQFKLSKLPTPLLELTWLKTINLASNQLDVTQIALLIEHLPQLQTLDLVDNELSQLPASIGQLSQLQTLYLFDNELNQLPDSIGQLSQLQTLDLRRNQLNQLPASMVKLTQLKRLWLRDNPIKELPPELKTLEKVTVFKNK